MLVLLGKLSTMLDLSERLGGRGQTAGKLRERLLCRVSAALPKNNFRLPVGIVLWVQWFVMYVSGQKIMSETGFRKTWKALRRLL